jgi:hypothetical protein
MLYIVDMNKKYIKYINYIVDDIELPYIKYLEQYGLKQEEYEMVLSKVFKVPVSITGNNVYDTNDNEIYYETSDGYWIKYEYDNQRNITYYENSTGYWVKKEYDDNDNEIYQEYSNGSWIKYEYDDNDIEIYYEDSYGDIQDYR